MTENINEDAPSEEQEEVVTSEETTESIEDPGENDELGKAQQAIVKLKRELKELKKSSGEPEGEVKEEKPPINNKKPDESDYSDLVIKTYLKSEGVEHPDDQKMVLEEARRLQMKPDQILQEGYMQARLKTAKDERDVQGAMPRGRGGSGKTRQDVDYWVNRRDKDGRYETPDDPELAEKVINARMTKEEKAGMFDPIR